MKKFKTPFLIVILMSFIAIVIIEVNDKWLSYKPAKIEIAQRQNAPANGMNVSQKEIFVHTNKVNEETSVEVTNKYFQHKYDHDTHISAKKHKIKYEERPDMPILSGKEKEMYLAYLESRNTQISTGINKVIGQTTTESSYINGSITGTWERKITHTSDNGYRVDNSVYDSLNNVFYVVSYAGHLYKLEYQNGVKWTVLNHKIQLNPWDYEPIVTGTVVNNSFFRLIRSNEESNRMEYSDNDGVTWVPATGANVGKSWINQSSEITVLGQKRIFIHTLYNNTHYIYFSDNNGQSYTASKLNFSNAIYDVKMAMPFNTNEMWLLVWHRTNKTAQLYKYNSDVSVKDFQIYKSSTSSIQGTDLINVAATYTGGKYHYYLSTANSNGVKIFYSADEGTSWVEKNSGRDKTFEIIIPDKPNVLISGFEDMRISTDYGITWNGFGWVLGWDLQHLKTFPKRGGKFITLAGLDFGCYISETPDIKTSYIWCNDGAHYAMHYDAASSENFNTVYLANQDRGATAYEDTGDEVQVKGIDGTDVLRVTYAKNERSVWSWFYYGRIKHRFTFPTGKTNEAVYDGLGNWWAAPIIPSPNSNEDAIYAAYGAKIQKFTYNEGTNSITKSEHPFDFKTTFGDNIGGFGYSEVNRNNWYTALNNGVFLYSKDAGNTWLKSTYTGTKPVANDQQYNYAKNQIVIKASESDPNKVYYAGVGNFILISNDGGKTFVQKSLGLNVYRIRDFVVTPDDKYIFAACSFQGIWVFSVDNNRWYQMSDSPVPTVDFTDVEYIRNKNTIRFASFGYGVLDFKLNKNITSLATPTNLHAKIENNNTIKLTWSDNSVNESGYYIERAINGEFERIDTLAANTSSFIDNNMVFNDTIYYVVKAFDSNSVLAKSTAFMMVTPQKGIITNINIKVIAFDSQEIIGADNKATNTIDNNPLTLWQTSWKNSQPKHPHFIAFDLGETTPFVGFRYLSRQDGKLEGIVADYEVYVTNDTSSWGEPVLRDKFIVGNKWKESILPKSSEARYVKLVFLSSIYADVYSSVAELAFLYEGLIPEKPTNLMNVASSDNQLYFKWTDNSINEKGFLIEQYIDDEFVRLDTTKAGVPYYYHRNLQSSTKYTYRIKAYNQFGFSEPSNILEATTKTRTGLPELNTRLKIYPNPCADYLNLEFESFNTDVQLRIIDYAGNIVRTRKIPKGTEHLKLPLVGMAKGNYILELIGNGGKIVRKIQKI